MTVSKFRFPDPKMNPESDPTTLNLTRLLVMPATGSVFLLLFLCVTAVGVSSSYSRAWMARGRPRPHTRGGVRRGGRLHSPKRSLKIFPARYIDLVVLLLIGRRGVAGRPMTISLRVNILAPGRTGGRAGVASHCLRTVLCERLFDY